MTNDIALFKTAGLSLASIGKYKEALAKVQAAAPQIGGKPILRLDKEGVWRFGQQLTEIEPGSLWAANPLSFQKGFTAWQKGVNKPRGSQLKNILSGELVDRNMLPDLTPANWTESVEVDFKCINGEDAGTEVRFASNSAGGVERWHELVAHLSHQFEVDPTKLVAIVSLEHDGYFHNDQSFGVRHPESKKPGWVVKPIFKVVDWMALDGTGNTALEEPEGEEEAQTQQPAAQMQTPPASTGRRASTIGQTGSGAAPATTPTRRQSTIKTDGVAQPMGDAEAAGGSPPNADPVVRRRRRVAS